MQNACDMGGAARDELRDGFGDAVDQQQDAGTGRLPECRKRTLRARHRQGRASSRDAPYVRHLPG